VWIIVCNLPERSFCGPKRKRMQQGHAALEGFLNSWRTRDWEAHGAQLLVTELVVVVAFVSGRGTDHCNKRKQKCNASDHQAILRQESSARC